MNLKCKISGHKITVDTIKKTFFEIRYAEQID